MATYVGKSQSLGKRDGAGKPRRVFHPLWCHVYDVLNCGREMWRVNAFNLRSLPSRLDMDEELFLSLWQFGLLVHDIGKLSAPWQRMAQGEGQPVSHVGFGLALMARACAVLGSGRRLRKLLHPFLAHHGHFAIALSTEAEQFGASNRKEALAFINKALRDSGLDLKALEAWYSTHERQWREYSWDVAALVVLADWLGSMEEFFPFAGENADPEAYARISEERAALAIRALPLPSESYPDPEVTRLFPFIRKLTPLQDRLLSLPLAKGSGLLLCEDLTGSGKTEAALLYVARLLSAGRARRVIFALPSQATSNAIYARLKNVYRSFFMADHPSLMLAHGARAVNADFVKSALNSDESLGTKESPSFCSAFLASHLQLSLLADVTVCTLDQVLLALLMGVKHQSLRLLGLRDAVLIIDEVHSYDRYTGFLLQKLVALHASRGGTVIALSATLTSRMRQGLTRAFLEGCAKWQGQSAIPVSLPPFLKQEALSVPLPCLTHLDASAEGALEAFAAPERKLACDFIHSEKDALSLSLTAAREGKCVIWVRNTVSDALSAYATLKKCVTAAENLRLRLFHSRFCLSDRDEVEREILRRFGKNSGPAERRGCLLIATQVVEQSLDVDCDVLISDLAPADLLLQRAGRLHRHARLPDGTLKASGLDERPVPVLYVNCPAFEENPDEDTFSTALGGTAFVYTDLDMLWRTQRFLVTHRALSLPSDCRAFLEEALSEGGTERFPKSGAKVKELSLQMDSAAHNAYSEVEYGYLPRTESAAPDDPLAKTRFGEDNVEVLLLHPDLTPYTPYVTGDRTGLLSTVRVRRAWLNRFKCHYPELFVDAGDCPFLKQRRIGEHPVLLIASPSVYDGERGLHGGKHESAY